MIVNRKEVGEACLKIYERAYGKSGIAACEALKSLPEQMKRAAVLVLTYPEIFSLKDRDVSVLTCGLQKLETHGEV